MKRLPAPFLATYRPLCRTSLGLAAVAKYGIPPYVDGSRRREPDFEGHFPTLTALCRGGMFAPRLREGDRVAYITKLGRYGGMLPAHWRLTALLLVERRFESHTAAGEWFRSNGMPLPRNCIVPDNQPMALDHTDGVAPQLRAKAYKLTPEEIIRQWDLGYHVRARKWGVVLVCTPLFRDLWRPPKITREDWDRWNGQVPATQTPPQITEQLWAKLQERASTAG